MLSKGNETKDPRADSLLARSPLVLPQVARFKALSISFKIISSSICTATAMDAWSSMLPGCSAGQESGEQGFCTASSSDRRPIETERSKELHASSVLEKVVEVVSRDSGGLAFVYETAARVESHSRAPGNRSLLRRGQSNS